LETFEKRKHLEPVSFFPNICKVTRDPTSRTDGTQRNEWAKYKSRVGKELSGEMGSMIRDMY
jgi:hypothetical protein